MNKLKREILENLDDESLYQLHLKYPSLLVTQEWKRKLSSGNPEEYKNVLDLLLNEKIPKDIHILEGLNNLKYLFPWRIGIIYNYQTGHLENIEVKVGNVGKYKSNKNIPLTFTWLYAKESHLLLREMTSHNASNLGKKISFPLPENSSRIVTDILFGNENIEIKVGGYHRDEINTFEHPLEKEIYHLYPLGLFTERKKLDFISFISHPPQTFEYDVRIQFSEEALKLKQLL